MEVRSNHAARKIIVQITFTSYWASIRALLNRVTPNSFNKETRLFSTLALRASTLAFLRFRLPVLSYSNLERIWTEKNCGLLDDSVFPLIFICSRSFVYFIFITLLTDSIYMPPGCARAIGPYPFFFVTIILIRKLPSYYYIM